MAAATASQVNAATGAGPKAIPGPKITVTVQHPAPAPASRAAAGRSAVSGKAAASSNAPSRSTGQTPVQSSRARAAAQTKPAAPAAFNPLQQLLSTGQGYSTAQLADIANRVTSQATQASLIPLRQQATQIGNTQATVSNRLAGYNATGDQIMQGIGANAQAGALTNENVAAQQATATANAIDKTGAAAQSLNGGYLDPQVAAALQSQRTQFGTNAGAQAGFLSSQGQNENNFMSNLRGTAALAGIEGQQNVASIYGKQLATNRAAQQTDIAKMAPTAKSLASTYGQQQVTDYAALQGVGDKAQLAKIAQQTANANAKAKAAAAATQAYGAQTTRNNDQATQAYRQAQLAVTSGNDSTKNRLAAVGLALKSRGLDQQQQQYLRTNKVALQKLADAEARPGTVPQKTANAITGQGNYYHTLVTTKDAKGNVASAPQAQAIITQGLKNDGVAAKAAIEYGVYGYINAQTEAQLRAQGVPISPLWTAKRPAALPPVKPLPPIIKPGTPLLPANGVGG